MSTRYGRLRGFRRDGIYIFRGIEYGATTEGAARFLPAREPAPWEGVKTALSYGPVSPQPARDWSNDVMAFWSDWNDGHPGENCLTLNVWSSNLSAGARRPVVVWFHGGGYTTGSAIEQPAYDGARLAARGAVVVTVNHRLGALGFMDLSHVGGTQYARSGNVGILDLVQSLRWVKDNIAAFGGDPARVTIFGQSGGGGKVSALMAMPEASGLFHRAMVMSGSNVPGRDAAAARALTDAVMKELGLAPNDIAGLQKVPAQRLVDAGIAAQRSLATAGVMGAAWGPVRDGAVLPTDAWVNGAPTQSASVPLIVGNVRDEFKGTARYDEAGLRKRAQELYKDKADAVLAALQSDYPSLSADDRVGALTGITVRKAAITQADKKAAQAGAPVYMYYFTFEGPLLDGGIGVPHCADINYVFDNTARCDALTGDTPEARAVADRFSRAFLQFAATGDPGTSALAWPRYDARKRTTMVFGPQVRAQDDPGGATLKAIG